MLQSPLTLAQVAIHNKAGSDQNDQIFEICKQFHQLPNQFVRVFPILSTRLLANQRSEFTIAIL